ncbi:MAG: hypothetical protein ACK4OP_01570 [Gemmobacter sp.]
MDYRVARGLFGFIAAAGWVVTVLAAVAAMLILANAPARSNAAISALVVAGPMALGGLVLVALAQFGLATIDTADHASRLHALAEDGRKTQRQMLAALEQIARQGAPAPADPTPDGDTRPAYAEVVEVVRGVSVLRGPTGHYFVGTKIFSTIEAARAHAERMAGRA